jgi:formylmethanofuran dehydrogenase subunit A
MTELLIKNACVIDPINRINADVMDIAIRDGRIVESVSAAAEVINAHSYLTLPGGIDSHSHVCGTKVNFGRYMSPEDMRAGRTARSGKMHVTSGYYVPTRRSYGSAGGAAYPRGIYGNSSPGHAGKHALRW